MKNLSDLFEKNSKWAKNIKATDPEFFSELSKGQSPQYLWIGCSDSRVPATQVTGLEPGDIFVHRNIANVIDPTDLNFLSVLQYAVEVLQVEDILLCGHYGCGGVQAASEDADHGLIDNWLQHIKRATDLHSDELDQLQEDEKVDRMCELNVLEQVKNLVSTPIIQKAWDKEQDLTVHGLIYSLEDGNIKDLDIHISSNEELNERYE